MLHKEKKLCIARKRKSALPLAGRFFAVYKVAVYHIMPQTAKKIMVTRVKKIMQ